ncbi:MAG: PD-(D/E)XK nuclease family protein [Gammaproteobacteria bacterium]|nr:PD-(D/E)XK nuclease family protein [Gammaproteobacteria bacterium]
MKMKFPLIGGSYFVSLSDSKSMETQRTMTAYYTPKRTRNLFDPLSSKPYKISRSKLDLFMRCPRCFYIDRRLGVGQPSGYPFNLNSAVDTLLKKEFDCYREQQKPHPLMLENNINAVPFLHLRMDEWRDSLRRGIQFPIPETNIILTGGVDDVWIDLNTQELIIVDYKATSKAEAVSLDAEWQMGYKKQAEIYQWLFRQNGFSVSNTAYFVYCNGRTDVDSFDKKLFFSISVLPYEGSSDWVEPIIYKAHGCLCADEIPAHGTECDFCQYILASADVIQR